MIIMVNREATEWCRIWIPGANNEALPRVLLVGDSIAESYFCPATVGAPS